MGREIRLSATRMSTFLQCKQKYWFNYVEHLPKLDNPVFRLGIAVHGALEFAGKIWQEKDEFSKADITKILKEYDRLSVSEGIEDMTVHKEGRELVKKRVKDFRLGKRIVSLETKFGFESEPNSIDVRTADGVPLMGAMDKVVEVNEDTILIVDYKTSKTAPTVDQLKHDTQLSLYDLVASIVHPDYPRIIVSLDLLKHDIMYSYRTLDERREFEAYLKIVYGEMLALKEKDVRPQLNMFCGWCDYREYCTGYKKAKDKTHGQFQQLVETDSAALVDEWEQMKNTKKILEQREREIAMILMENIRNSGANISTDEVEVYVRQNSRKNYDLETVHSLVPNKDFVGMVNLNKKAVEKYFDRNPAVKDKIVDSATTNFTSPFLATRKKKK
jgi:RecB family exonuclease